MRLLMKELSIFIDESGDFGEYEQHCPYYLISMVFHDQSKDISSEVASLDSFLGDIGFSKDFYIHTGPVIRREREYKYMSLEMRRKLIAHLMGFFRKTNVLFEVFHIEKKHIMSPISAVDKLSKQISLFIQKHQTNFYKYVGIKIYYDTGQSEVTKIIGSVFNSLMQKVTYRKANPSRYKLFQVSDLFCTMELLRLKLRSNSLSKTEMVFFESKRNLQKQYLNPLRKKRYI